MLQSRIIYREERLEVRTALLEKELTRFRDQLGAERRALPWDKIEKNCVFDGPRGKVTLAHLFRSAPVLRRAGRADCKPGMASALTA